MVREGSLPDYQDVHWLTVAYTGARNSSDKSTQNGAVIVNPDGMIVSSGWNSPLTRLEPHPERFQRPQKYLYTEHAERAACFRAAKYGVSLNNCTMYCPWFACPDCARGIVLSGIKSVVGHLQSFDKTPEHWKESVGVGTAILRECGVATRLIDHKFDLGFELLFNGSHWSP